MFLKEQFSQMQLARSKVTVDDIKEVAVMKVSLLGSGERWESRRICRKDSDQASNQ